MALRAQTVTLVAATVATITLDSAAGPYTLTNHGAGTINYRIGRATAPPDPTVDGDECDVLLAVTSQVVHKPGPGSFIVKVISAGTPKFTAAGQ